MLLSRHPYFSGAFQHQRDSMGRGSRYMSPICVEWVKRWSRLPLLHIDVIKISLMTKSKRHLMVGFVQIIWLFFVHHNAIINVGPEQQLPCPPFQRWSSWAWLCFIHTADNCACVVIMHGIFQHQYFLSLNVAPEMHYIIINIKL